MSYPPDGHNAAHSFLTLMDSFLVDTVAANPHPDSVGVDVVVCLSIQSHDMLSVHAVRPPIFFIQIFTQFSSSLYLGSAEHNAIPGSTLQLPSSVDKFCLGVS